MKKFVLISGGKDSAATLFKVLEKEKNKNIEGLFCDTGFEHSSTYRYLDELEKFTGVKINKVKNEKVTMLEIIEKYMPTDRFRACNTYLKTYPTKKFIRQFDEDILLYVGVRKDESPARNKRYAGFRDDEMYESKNYSSKRQKVYEMYPILNFTEKEVFEFIESKGFYANPLYGKGIDRVGCFPCVCSNMKEIEFCLQDEEGRRNIEKILEIVKKKDLEKVKQEASNYYKMFKLVENKRIQPSLF
jgi:3'-phosphoadenosine 5'-phosphosulfate sulfotransferase (PAPS reductase)/FAD synthetase